nr:MAG TPA: hypothetical protein [Caudoviricetes sp.]
MCRGIVVGSCDAQSWEKQGGLMLWAPGANKRSSEK